MFDFQKEMNKLLNPLYILGVWYKGNGGFTKSLYYIYALILTIFYNTHNIAQLANIALNFTSMKEWSLSGVLALTEALTTYKAYFYFSHRRRIRELYQKVNQDMFQPKNLQQKQSARRTLDSFKIWYRIHATGPTFTVIGFASYALFGADRQGTLPFAAAYPFNATVSPLYEFTFIHQCTTSIIMAHIHIHADCFYCLCFAIIGIQFDFLCDNLKHIPKENMEEELLKCIKHHQEIFLFHGEVCKMVDVSLIGQLILTTTSFCFTTFQMSLVTPGGSQFFALSEYALALIMQLMIFCWWGNEITYKGLEVPQAAFESNWLDGSIKFRKMLLFLLRRAQKPLAVFALGFFAVALNTFMLVLKNSYSFYALLRSNSRD